MIDSIMDNGLFIILHTPEKLAWIPKIMVWKRWFLLNMAIFGIYVKSLGGNNRAGYFLGGLALRRVASDSHDSTDLTNLGPGTWFRA